MNYTDLQLQRIAKARKRPIELSPAEFVNENRIKRYDPAGYTFMKFNPGNVPEDEQSCVQERVFVRDSRINQEAAGEQLDLFFFETRTLG